MRSRPNSRSRRSLTTSRCSQAQKAHAKAEPQRHARLGRVHDGRVVERELVQRVAQVLEVLGVDGEDARVHHGLDLAVARAGLGGGPAGVGDGVAHAHEQRVLEAGDHVAHLAHAQVVQRGVGRAAHAHLLDLDLLPAAHEAHLLAGADRAVDHADEGHHAAVGVEVRVEDERLERRLGVTGGRGDVGDDGLEELVECPRPSCPTPCRRRRTGWRGPPRSRSWCAPRRRRAGRPC